MVEKNKEEQKRILFYWFFFFTFRINKQTTRAINKKIYILYILLLLKFLQAFFFLIYYCWFNSLPELCEICGWLVEVTDETEEVAADGGTGADWAILVSISPVFVSTCSVNELIMLSWFTGSRLLVLCWFNGIVSTLFIWPVWFELNVLLLFGTLTTLVVAVVVGTELCPTARLADELPSSARVSGVACCLRSWFSCSSREQISLSCLIWFFSATISSLTASVKWDLTKSYFYFVNKNHLIKGKRMIWMLWCVTIANSMRLCMPESLKIWL